MFVEGEGIVELDGLVLGLVEVQSLSHEWFELCVNNTTSNMRARERERGNELASMNECELGTWRSSVRTGGKDSKNTILLACVS